MAEKQESKIQQLRVAIIGAGPSGLSQLRAFESAQKKGEQIPYITCFERQKDWGGLWNYSWRTGFDEFGEPVHSGMYKHLWSNGPKECLEFADYTFEEHFGKVISSFPPREVLQDYIRGRLAKSNFRNLIRFCTTVRFVEFNKEKQVFQVTVQDLVKNVTTTEEFDYVICANGHYSTANVPHYEGLDEYAGRVIHSHDFRNGSDYKDMDVLVVGTSYSGEDIASHCYKYGCKSVTISYRSKPQTYKWPENFSQAPLLVKADKNNIVYFKDGTKKHVDAIILCTGYINYYPFLAEDLKLKTNNRMWPLKLYKGVVWEDNTKMIYLGMQDQFYTFNMFDVQAWWARDYICGKIQLPSKEEMTAYNQEWRAKEEIISNPEQAIVFQSDNIKDLMKQTDYPQFDIDGVNQAFFEWEHHKQEDILAYRDKSFKSLMTGNMATKHHTPWLQEFDDSMQNFMK